MYAGRGLLIIVVQMADELAAAGIPVILSATRPGPTNWDRRDVFVGPPLTRSPASILSEAGVDYAVSVAAESKHRPL